MGDEVWFPPGEAAMGRGEEEPAAPDATMLMGDEVLQEEGIKLLEFLSDDCLLSQIHSKLLMAFKGIFK